MNRKDDTGKEKAAKPEEGFREPACKAVEQHRSLEKFTLHQFFVEKLRLCSRARCGKVAAEIQEIALSADSIKLVGHVEKIHVIMRLGECVERGIQPIDGVQKRFRGTRPQAFLIGFG